MREPGTIPFSRVNGVKLTSGQVPLACFSSEGRHSLVAVATARRIARPQIEDSASTHMPGNEAANFLRDGAGIVLQRAAELNGSPLNEGGMKTVSGPVIPGP